MATWPATLPLPIRPGYGGESGNPMIRTDFDSGPARQRKRFTDVPDKLNLTFKFKAAEMAIFKNFWKLDINAGTDWFLMTLDLGFGLSVYEVRCTSGQYQFSARPGMNWNVSFPAEVRTP